MPYPVITFPTIAQWENYVNTAWVTNGEEAITGVVGNNGVNGAIKFLKQSPLNWSKAAIYSSGGDIVLSNEYQGVAMFITTTPDSLSFGSNFYKQYLIINATDAAIPLDTPSGYYTVNGTTTTTIPANSAVNLFLADNDIWVGWTVSNGGGGGNTQKQPNTYVVGTTSGAPIAGETTWTNTVFENSYVFLFVNGVLVHQRNAGDGSFYLTKLLSSDTLTINNYPDGWTNGDILDYILITP